MATYPELSGRVVLVTGATGGLGHALAVAFARQGARLALSDLDGDRLDRMRHELGRENLGSGTFQVDLSDPEGAPALVSEVIQRFGRLDVLVNNAAIISRMPLGEVTAREFEQVLRINLISPFLLARAALAHMSERGSGRILNVASAAARTGGTSDVYMYAASKGGLVSVTRSLARVAAASGVLVNAILPANIDSPMLHDAFPPDQVRRVIAQIPLGRTGTPDEVAELALWLSSDAASYVTGVAWDINGGWVMS